MDLKQVEKILESVGPLLEIEGVAEVAIAPLLQKAYKGLVEKYRPVIRALPSVSEDVAQDLVPLLKTVMVLTNKVRSDEEFQQILKEGFVLKAQAKKTQLEAYMAAEFSREEAMALMLNDSQYSFQQTVMKYARSGSTFNMFGGGDSSESSDDSSSE